MILVTVGSQTTFNRLIRAAEAWATSRARYDVVFQVARGGYRPENMESYEILAPIEFRHLVEKADIVVAHAGIGTLIGALEMGKPLIVMPRSTSLRETRNDHQYATARRLAQGLGASVVESNEELYKELDAFVSNAVSSVIARNSSTQLIRYLRPLFQRRNLHGA